jgi:hypothetical protein
MSNANFDAPDGFDVRKVQQKMTLTQAIGVALEFVGKHVSHPTTRTAYKSDDGYVATAFYFGR